MEEIPSINIDEIEVPIVRQLEPPIVMSPIITQMERPIVQVPSAEVPHYEPIDVPTLEEWRKMEKKQSNNSEEEKEESESENSRQMPAPKLPATPVIQVPIVGEIPVPPKETVILSGTTATASVAAALIGKSLVEQLVKIFKPIIKTLIGQIKKLLGRDLTPYETQLLLAMTLEKKVKKSFQKDQKKEKAKQMEVWEEQRRHRNRFLRKDSSDGNGSHSS